MSLAAISSSWSWVTRRCWCLREVLAQQPVGVLVRASLPRTLGVAEVDLHAGVDGEPLVVGELESAVPGQRPAQLDRKRLDVAGQGVDDVFGGPAFGEPDRHHEPGGALDQGRDLGPA